MLKTTSDEMYINRNRSSKQMRLKGLLFISFRNNIPINPASVIELRMKF